MANTFGLSVYVEVEGLWEPQNEYTFPKQNEYVIFLFVWLLVFYCYKLGK